MARTLIQECREGRIPDVVEKVARDEGVSPYKLRDRIAKGQVIIPRNFEKPPRKFVGIGRGLFTKININVGTSTDVVDLEMELKKVEIANKWGDTLMDLSIGGDIDAIRRAVIEKAQVPVGTVPIYQAFVEASRNKGGGVYLSEDDIFKTIERHLKDGVTFMTLHAALTYDLVVKALKSERVMPIVSRGGDMIAAWMLYNKAENPFYRHWDYILELFAEYDAVISIGDALRPGAIYDAHDELHIAELIEAARLAKKAVKYGVQVMIEGPGHVPLDEIVWDIKLEKKLTNGIPYYVLGPLPTDVAAPYDHIAAAVGAALAAATGADLLCYLTPAEHLSLPTPEQVEEGAIAFRIAAHIGDTVKLGERARRWDREVSELRGSLRMKECIERLIDPERAWRVYTQFGMPRQGACTMCGGFCPVMQAKRQRELLGV